MTAIYLIAALAVGLIAGMIAHYFVVRSVGAKSIAAANQMIKKYGGE